MIIQGETKPDLLLPDMTFLTMTINQPVTETYKNYKVLCPTILFAEIYNDASGAKKRLENTFEVLYIDPWQLLVKNELEGKSIIQDNRIAPVHLKSTQEMDKKEKEIVDDAKKLIKAFDENDKFWSTQTPTLKRLESNAFIGFAHANYQQLTWDQFIKRFKKVSKGTLFEPIARIAEMPATDRNIVRAAIEKTLSEYAKQYPINNFEKAFAFSEVMLADNFAGICNDILIPMLEGHSEVDRTHWDNTRDNLTDSRIRESFPYTWYALYHYLAFHVYQMENAHNKRIGSRDFEYLYYLYFPNILFVFCGHTTQKICYWCGVDKIKALRFFCLHAFR